MQRKEAPFLDLELKHVDRGTSFDFGKTSEEYGQYRDIYPDSLFEKLIFFGIGRKGQTILDVGTGTGVIPRKLYATGAKLYGLDISPEQIAQAQAISKGMDILYRAEPADQTGFDGGTFDAVTACQCFHYFSAETFVPELLRILRPGGAFCVIFMEWLPYEDPMIAEMERLILSYHPNWTGCGFQPGEYFMPEWAKANFELETYHAYRESLRFTEDAWCGRIRTCRGIGASLEADRVLAFDREHRRLLRRYERDGALIIPHHIRMEVYRKK